MLSPEEAVTDFIARAVETGIGEKLAALRTRVSELEELAAELESRLEVLNSKDYLGRRDRFNGPTKDVKPESRPHASSNAALTNNQKQLLLAVNNLRREFPGHQIQCGELLKRAGLPALATSTANGLVIRGLLKKAEGRPGWFEL